MFAALRGSSRPFGTPDQDYGRKQKHLLNPVYVNATVILPPASARWWVCGVVLFTPAALG
jgi:hypothetical protein